MKLHLHTLLLSLPIWSKQNLVRSRLVLIFFGGGDVHHDVSDQGNAYRGTLTPDMGDCLVCWPSVWAMASVWLSDSTTLPVGSIISQQTLLVACQVGMPTRWYRFSRRISVPFVFFFSGCKVECIGH